MKIYDFLEEYSTELKAIYKTYDDWEKWNLFFQERTGNYKATVIAEYFSESISLIKNREIDKAISLSIVFQTGYFDTSCEDLFLNLVLETKNALITADGIESHEQVYNLQYIVFDFLFHEYIYSTRKKELLKVLNEIKTIINKQKVNEGSNSHLVLDKIELIEKA